MGGGKAKPVLAVTRWEQGVTSRQTFGIRAASVLGAHIPRRPPGGSPFGCP
jgi:hypothetical protein